MEKIYTCVYNYQAPRDDMRRTETVRSERGNRTHVSPGTAGRCRRSVFSEMPKRTASEAGGDRWATCGWEIEGLPCPRFGQHQARQACVVSRTRLPRRPAVSVRAVNRDHPAFYDIVPDDLAVSMDGNFGVAHAFSCFSPIQRLILALSFTMRKATLTLLSADRYFSGLPSVESIIGLLKRSK